MLADGRQALSRVFGVKLMAWLLADARDDGQAWQAEMPSPTRFRETNPIWHKSIVGSESYDLVLG